MTIALAQGINPTKIEHSDKLIPRLPQWVEEGRSTHTEKASCGGWCPQITANELDWAIRDLALIAFYYLLRVGEYTTKASKTYTKQTIQFRLCDVTFFKTDATGRLRQLSRSAPPSDILAANSATLRLENQKNGWKGVCIHQERNGANYCCPVLALARRVTHIQAHRSTPTTTLSTYFTDNVPHEVTDKDISRSLKLAAIALDYPSQKGIPIDRVDTHSLRSGGANALSLSGYSDREIQKMGRWRSATFKEYIREELACFSAGMSTNMRRRFNFVNIAGGTLHDVTHSTVVTNYDTNDNTPA